MSKKRKLETLESILERPWCYYCEKDFLDLNNLVDHQKKQHFKCPYCSRKLNSANGLVVHVANVHKMTIDHIENALPGRESTKVEVYAMEGIPEDLVQLRQSQTIMTYNQVAANHLAQTGNPLPGSAEARERANKARKTVPNEAEGAIKARVLALKAAKAARDAQKTGTLAGPSQAPTAPDSKQSVIKDDPNLPSGLRTQDAAYATSEPQDAIAPTASTSFMPSHEQPAYNPPGYQYMPVSSGYQAPQVPYVTAQSQYVLQAPYGTSQSPYGGAQIPYATSQAPYGAPQPPYGMSPPPYSPSQASYAPFQPPHGQAYGAQHHNGSPVYGQAPPPHAGYPYMSPEIEKTERSAQSPFDHTTKKRPSIPNNTKDPRKKSLPTVHGLPARPSFNIGGVASEVMSALHSGFQPTQDSIGGRGTYQPNTTPNTDVKTDKATPDDSYFFIEDDLDRTIAEITNGRKATRDPPNGTIDQEAQLTGPYNPRPIAFEDAPLHPNIVPVPSAHHINDDQADSGMLNIPAALADVRLGSIDRTDCAGHEGSDKKGSGGMADVVPGTAQPKSKKEKKEKKIVTGPYNPEEMRFRRSFASKKSGVEPSIFKIPQS